jgi:hypothetical protein
MLAYISVRFSKKSIPYAPLLDTEFAQKFFADIADIAGIYPDSARRYDCHSISDIHYCQLGVLRCQSTATTGQQFLQHHADENVANIDPSHFFKALTSPRRLHNISSLNELLAQPMRQPMRQRSADPIAQCPELAD